MFILLLRRSLPLLWGCLTLLLLRGCLTLLLLWGLLALLLLWSCLTLLLLRGLLALLLLRNLLTLLLLRSLLPLRSLLTLLLLRRNLLPLLLLRSRLMLLQLRSGLALLRLRISLPLLLLLLFRSLLPLLLLRSGLMLLLLRSRRALLRLRISLPLLLLLLLRSLLALLLLRSRLMLLLFRSRLALLRLRSCLPFLLLRSLLITHRLRRWDPHISVGRKWLVDCHASRASMVDVGKLGSICAGGAFILQLRRHRRRMGFAQSIQFLGSRSYLYATRSAIETDAGFASATAANGVFVDVSFDVDVDVVDRAVVVKVAATPITALVPKTDVAETVVDAAIVADVPPPVAAVEAIAVMPEAPVARSPESTLVGSLDPRARNPVVAHWSKGPIAGRPDVVVAGILRLVVIGQGRRGLACVLCRLLPVARIIGTLVGRLVIATALVLLWRTRLIAGSGIRCVLR